MERRGASAPTSATPGSRSVDEKAPMHDVRREATVSPTHEPRRTMEDTVSRRHGGDSAGESDSSSSPGTSPLASDSATALACSAVARAAISAMVIEARGLNSQHDPRLCEPRRVEAVGSGCEAPQKTTSSAIEPRCSLMIDPLRLPCEQEEEEERREFSTHEPR